ncbi:N-formylglutamate amidohydrolase [Novosphingobium panipatense]|uniref:N-formylglutamate amidohydrolase n=1 Tax=Novosphingobium panipatense TaxID=428991 RepID=UPI003618FA4E
MVEPSDETDSQEKAGGSIPGSPEGAAFFLLEREPSRIPVLIAAPHGGRGYSRGLLADLRHGLSAVLRLEDRHVDAVARDVAQVTGASLLVAHAPRAMVDLNRAPDDIDWDMFLRDARPPGASPHQVAVRGAAWDWSPAIADRRGSMAAAVQQGGSRPADRAGP